MFGEDEATVGDAIDFGKGIGPVFDVFKEVMADDEIVGVIIKGHGFDVGVVEAESALDVFFGFFDGIEVRVDDVYFGAW